MAARGRPSDALVRSDGPTSSSNARGGAAAGRRTTPQAAHRGATATRGANVVPHRAAGSGSGLACRSLHQVLSPVSCVSSDAIHGDNPKRMSDGIRTGKREGLNYTIARRVIELPPGRCRLKVAVGSAT
jgi:hypothetical protein